jgi:hypothetical protein
MCSRELVIRLLFFLLDSLFDPEVAGGRFLLIVTFQNIGSLTDTLLEPQNSYKLRH